MLYLDPLDVEEGMYREKRLAIVMAILLEECVHFQQKRPSL